VASKDTRPLINNLPGWHSLFALDSAHINRAYTISPDAVDCFIAATEFGFQESLWSY
jgi:hypothetical protein